ncbi:MAG: hypothetical protein ABFD46_11100 [Armatimonadota bacterium]
MNLRVLYGSLGVICIIALAIVGSGVYFESQRAPEAAKKQVFCNMDELEPCHPAWNQLVQVREMMSLTQRNVRFQKNSSVSRSIDSELRDPAVVSESRTSLQTKIEKKAQQEMKQISSHLEDALEKRLNERRQDLEAQAGAAEAEARRESEKELAVDLRALNEERQYERVDAAIKLYALKAQLVVDGLSLDEVKQAIASRENELNDIKSKLTQSEKDLVTKMAEKSLQAGEKRRKSIERELASIRNEETRRINDLIRKKSERLRYDLVNNSFGESGKHLASSRTTAFDSDNTGWRYVSSGIVLKSSVNAGCNDSLDLEKSLHIRIRSELEAAVRRIARQNGLNVVFKNTGEVEDRTDWFRERLPYLSSRVKKYDRH